MNEIKRDGINMIETRDHVVIGIISILLFVSYKMYGYNMFAAIMMSWFNTRVFESYCRYRKAENDGRL